METRTIKPAVASVGDIVRLYGSHNPWRVQSKRISRVEDPLTGAVSYRPVYWLDHGTRWYHNNEIALIRTAEQDRIFRKNVYGEPA